MSKIRKAIAGGALVATALAGGALGAELINGTAGAATSPTSATTAPATSTAPAGAPDRDPAREATWPTASPRRFSPATPLAEAQAAALKAVPGGTVERVENDAEGATYQAHVTKADGSDVTVRMDASFKVTDTLDGHG